MTSSPSEAGDMSAARYASIDVWRGLAALAVVAMHFPHDAPGGFRQHPFFFISFLMDFGYLGVPFFVLISGFCIHRKSAMNYARSGSYQLNWRRFWKRRFWRLYPTYLVAMVFSVAAAMFLHQRTQVHEKFTWDLISHLCMFHNLTDEFATGMTNGVFWSLGMEEQLYGLYFLLFAMLSSTSHRTALYVIGGVSIAWRVAVPFLLNTTVDMGVFHLGSWYHWPFQFWLHWTLGALAVDAFFGNIRLPKWCYSAFTGIGLSLFSIIAHTNTLDLLKHTSFAPSQLSTLNMDAPLCVLWRFIVELLFALAFFCFINWGLSREANERWPNWLTSLFAPIGKISYSLYLVHIPILFTLERVLPFDSSPVGWLLRGCCYLPVILFLSAVFYWGVERHFLGSVNSSQEKQALGVQFAQEGAK